MSSITAEINKMLHGDREMPTTSFSDAIVYDPDEIEEESNEQVSSEIPAPEPEVETTETGIQTNFREIPQFKNFCEKPQVQTSVGLSDFKLSLLKRQLEKNSTFRDVFQKSASSLVNMSAEDVNYMLKLISMCDHLDFNVKLTLKTCKVFIHVAEALAMFLDPDNSATIVKETGDIIKELMDKDYTIDIINKISSSENVEFQESNPIQRTVMLLLHMIATLILKKLPDLPKYLKNFKRKREEENIVQEKRLKLNDLHTL